MTTEATPTTADAPASAQVDTAMRQVSSSSIVVQVCMQTILNQPDIVLTELPSLPGHQQTGPAARRQLVHGSQPVDD